jgi:hypothetical protein
MTKPAKSVTVATAMLGLLAFSAVAKRNYDPKTVETLQGKVVSLEVSSSPLQRDHGIHLLLQVGKANIAVHLGPAAFLRKQSVRMAVNDIITVTGSRVLFDGKLAIIAAEIKKGNEVLKLRDENGIPVWSGGGRRDREAREGEGGEKA